MAHASVPLAPLAGRSAMHAKHLMGRTQCAGGLGMRDGWVVRPPKYSDKSSTQGQKAAYNSTRTLLRSPWDYI